MTTSKTCLRPRILRLGILSWTYLGHKINVQDEIFNNVQDGKVSYKSIGSFKTRREAEYALEVYHENPIDYSQKIKTFEDLYNAWSYYYFEHVSVMEPGIVKRILGHSLRSDVTEYYYAHPEFSDFENEIRKLTFS